MKLTILKSIPLLLIGFALGWSSPRILHHWRMDKNFPKHGNEHQAPHEPGERGNGPRSNPAFDELDLSTEQKEKIDQLHSTSSKKHQEYREELKKLEDQFQGLINQDASYEEINSVFLKLLDRKNEMEKSFFNTIYSVHQVMTPEQRKKFLKSRSEDQLRRQEENMEEGHHPPPGHFGPPPPRPDHRERNSED